MNSACHGFCCLVLDLIVIVSGGRIFVSGSVCGLRLGWLGLFDGVFDVRY